MASAEGWLEGCGCVICSRRRSALTLAWAAARAALNADGGLKAVESGGLIAFADLAFWVGLVDFVAVRAEGFSAGWNIES